MTRPWATLACCLISAAACAAAQSTSERAKAEEARSCVQCHSLRLIHSQRLSKAAWTKEVDKMIGWGAPVRDRELLIDYLSEEYSDSKPVPEPERSGDGVKRAGNITDPSVARERKEKFVALTDSWAQDIEFTRAEQAAMQEGKQWEGLMTKGPDDPLAKKILAAGEPSYEALCSYYPGKILDRTVLGSYSDPRDPATGYNDEFAIYWNGAIAANLIKGRLTDRLGATGTQPVAFNTVIEFRVGKNAELLGRNRNNFSSIGYERGYLPVVTASYVNNAIRYREIAFAFKPEDNAAGADVAYAGFEITNTGSSPQQAVLDVDVVLNDGARPRFANGQVLDDSGALLLADSDAGATFDERQSRLSHVFTLTAGEMRRVCFEIPYRPDSRGLLGSASKFDFDVAHRRVADFWQNLLAKAVDIELPEQRINKIWRALLLQNFVLADGPRFTYGSGLRYNDSTYPQENGFATHVFAMYGFKDYADAMQAGFLHMSVDREGAGRKYQNRRAMVLHHLLEDYRLTGKTDLFDRFKSDYYRVADEIVADRHSTMKEVGREKPLYWGLLPPDKPGVDVQASTQTVYVPAHNITNCQGLEDFGRFLVVTGLDPRRGEQYLREAADFRRTLMSAMERAAIRTPGQPPFVDLQTLLFRQTPEYGPEPYDDLALGRLQGTYFHYWVDMEFHYNFFNPDDEVGQWLADYVQQHNGFVLGLTRARSQAGSLFGWVNNVYDGGYYDYRLRQGRIGDFLLGLYARLAFGMSRYVYVASEGSPFIGYNTQHGGFVGADYSFPNSAANADTLLMLRNALAMEELRNDIETGKLFLLRGAPKAWFASGKRIEVRRMPTFFGDVSFQISASPDGRVISAHIEPPAGAWKNIEISLRHPGSAPAHAVRVNGKDYSGFEPDGSVLLQHTGGPLSIEVWY